ncbi:hypothetical protein BV898_18716, partial [Hypsibius exemplaris]
MWGGGEAGGTDGSIVNLPLNAKGGCSLEVIALGDFAREWDVPLMAVIAVDLSLTNTLRFPTVVTFPSSDQLSLVRATLALFERYSWSTVSLLCGDVNPSGADNTLFYAATCSGFINALKKSSHIDALNVLHFDARTADNEGYENMLQTAGTQSRVILLFVATARRLRDIMVNDLTVSAAEVMSSITEVLSQFSSRQLEAMTGTDFRKHFLNRTFELESRSVFIGPKGMRICDVDLYRMNATTGEMEIVWQYKSVSDTFRQTSLQNVIWRSQNGPPVNRPVCGFRGDRCIGSLEKSAVATIVVLTVFSSFIFGAGIFWFSHQHMNESVWWLLEEMRLVSAITRSKLGSF